MFNRKLKEKINALEFANSLLEHKYLTTKRDLEWAKVNAKDLEEAIKVLSNDQYRNAGAVSDLATAEHKIELLNDVVISQGELISELL